MNSWVYAGPFDLSDATSGQIQFDLWLETEANYDNFKWLASTDGSSFSGFQTSTDRTGFQTVTTDLSDWGSAGNILGQPQVWIAFIYQSDESNTYEGAYIDEVVLTTNGGGGGSNCGTYVLTEDNDNNNYTGSPDGDWRYCLYNSDPKHPIEFSIDVDESSISSAQLLLLCHDVDQFTEPNNPEIDKVYVNNTYIGDLTGANEEDSTTIFTVPTSAISPGKNRFRIEVNQNPGAPPDEWCVELKQAQLIINGGCSGQATCRSVTTNSGSYAPGATVAVTYEIDTTAASQQIRVESNLLNPAGIIVAGAERNYTTSGSSNDPKTVNLALPANAVSGTYTAQVLVFDAATGQLESSCEAAFTLTGGGGGCTLSCSASAPSSAQVNQLVNLNATVNASGNCGDIEYFWFPEQDYSTATIFDRNATWSYANPGTYKWVFSAIADNGRCDRQGNISISGGGGGDATTTWIPVGSRANGANNSTWRTNVGIFNPGTMTATVIIRIRVTTGIISRTITIPGGGMRIITDVIGWIDPGTFGSGSISIVSNRTLIITSRTYNQFAVGAICFPVGTMGQALGGVLTNGGLSAGQTGWIPNLVENNFFRSNIGYTNTGTTTASLTVRLYNGDGVFLGSYNVNLAPGQWKQASQPFRDMPGYVWLDAGSAKITVNSGSGVVVYGSVIDNITNDPTTIPFYR
jgi:hypothetical protein